MTYWKEPIRTLVLAPLDNPNLEVDVTQVLQRAIDQISHSTSIDVQIVDAGETVDSPNLYVFLLHDELVHAWSQQGFAGLDPSGFELHRNAYEIRSCSGTGFFEPSEGVSEIELGLVFAPFDLTGRELEKCIFEEFVNLLGLLGDPRGQASLFDLGNYRVKDGEFYYSLETLVMLDALYEIASGRVSGTEEYTNWVCRKD